VQYRTRKRSLSSRELGSGSAQRRRPRIVWRNHTLQARGANIKGPKATPINLRLSRRLFTTMASLAFLQQAVCRAADGALWLDRRRNGLLPLHSICEARKAGKEEEQKLAKVECPSHIETSLGENGNIQCNT